MVRSWAEAHSEIDYLTATDRAANACVSLARQTKADCAETKMREVVRMGGFPHFCLFFFVIGLI